MNLETVKEDAPIPFFFSLRARLLLLVLLAVLPALGLILHSGLEQRRQAADLVENRGLQLSRLAAANQRRLIDDSRRLLISLSHLRELRASSAAECSALFAKLLAAYPYHANLGAIHTNGDMFCSALPMDDPVNLADRSYFQAAVATRDFAVGEFQLGRLTGKYTINLAYPFFGPGRVVAGVVFAALDLAWLERLAAIAQLPVESTMMVIDAEGRIVAHYPQVPELAGTDGRRFPIVRRIISSRREGTGEAANLRGVPNLFAFTPLIWKENLRGYVAVGIPNDVAFASANWMLFRNLLGLGLVAAAAMAAAWFGSEIFLLRRMNALLLATRRLQRGDWKARSGLPHGRGEIGRLARAFDTMAEALEQRLAERDQAAAELQLLNEVLEQRVLDRTRELQRSNEELEQFAYVASHDLQEPLRMVASYTQLLAQRCRQFLDKEGEEFVHHAVNGATRMQQLIHDLLEFSRVGTRGQPFEPTDANEVLRGVLENLSVTLQETRAAVLFDSLPLVHADPSQLIRLFQNLLGNAIKFRGDRPPEIHITAERENGFWKFAVADNGIGIEPRYFERIFVIFQRLHRPGKYPGTGIGLAICKKIVERHGGRIWVESTPGVGTTFYFTLPAA